MPEPLSVVRPVRPGDLSDLVRLCREHAAFERAPFDGAGLAERLETALFGPAPCVWGWVLAADDVTVRGYATATLEFSTWSGRAYMHLDCLFLEEGLRGAGHGARLMDAVRSAARDAGLAELQWQTPQWNAAAIRFYKRQGARPARKVRFTSPLER